jgi:hypothetical protein
MDIRKYLNVSWEHGSNGYLPSNHKALSSTLILSPQKKIFEINNEIYKNLKDTAKGGSRIKCIIITAYRKAENNLTSISSSFKHSNKNHGNEKQNTTEKLKELKVGSLRKLIK